ncbi:surface-adhesin E family protein [Brevundimonas sp. DWR2-3-1b1]|uniref:surface-adhesin E family protein n=1 Tax=unclassified Brevundimonas TaxID=2622653 RepID=UPI003CEE8755
MIALLLALLLTRADPQLVETGVGRFAIYADVASIEQDGDIAHMRELQVTEAGFKVGDVTYVGGWSRWAFDCRAKTADRLDFASLKSDGTEGPATADPAPAYAAAPGGDAAELLAVACGDRISPETLTLDEAIRRGQAALAD